MKQSDFSGYFFRLLRQIILLIKQHFFTFLFKINAKLRDVKLGEGSLILGRTLIHRYLHSEINIGNSGQFISNVLTNLVEVNRRCIISTHTKNATINIGNNCGFSGTVICSLGSITIGNSVLCGANCLIPDFDWHAVDPESRRSGNSISKPNNYL